MAGPKTANSVVVCNGNSDTYSNQGGNVEGNPMMLTIACGLDNSSSQTGYVPVFMMINGALLNMIKTMKCPEVWKPSLYMFLSIALSYSTHEGHFYWYTDPKAGPAFPKVTRTNFKNLWLAVLIRNILRISTLAFIFLVPKAGPTDAMLPSQMLEADGSEEKEERLQLVSKGINSSVVVVLAAVFDALRLLYVFFSTEIERFMNSVICTDSNYATHIIKHLPSLYNLHKFSDWLVNRTPARYPRLPPTW